MATTSQHLTKQPVYSLLDERRHIVAFPHSSLTHTVYTRLYQTVCWRNSNTKLVTVKSYRPESIYGAIFNIEFSPANDQALTVTSNRAILSYDPRLPSYKPQHILCNAHDDAVNCLTFLNHMSFATCSDDKTIRIWDLRQLRHSVAVLQGHKHWVKNIEYDHNSGLLFSIAFYDGVREWDMEKLSEYTNEDCSNLVFRITDPVRMRLSANGEKMFISERDNVCTVINSFDGRTLKEIAPTIESLRSNSKVEMYEQFKGMKTNRPSMYTMSGHKGTSYRAIMSALFYPCGDFIALRHNDVRNQQFRVENLSLFDLRQEVYEPKISPKDCQRKYLMYADEKSPRESIDYIKEISVSKDGRVIASPYGCGVRLLAIDEIATPPEVFFDNRYHSALKKQCTLDLHTLQVMSEHRRAVLACKFANNELLVASGCLEGHIFFHKPYL